MDIYIVTHGRHDRQITFNSLPPDIQERTKTVIQASEYHKWSGRDVQYKSILVLPDHIKDIASTREYLINMTDGKIVMLDDDMVFAIRRKDDPTKFLEATPHDITTMFKDIEYRLDMYAHVGVSHREGANRNIETYLENNRYMRILAYHCAVLKEVGVKFGRVPVMEDFDINLQLLRKAMPSKIINWIVHNQGGSNTAGGCSGFRTLEVQEQAANKMAELHPGFVKTRKVKTKTSWGGQERTDVTIYWKKAFKEGCSV